jgi:pimeloyl-ACP methyl ester carboxylesterase
MYGGTGSFIVRLDEAFLEAHRVRTDPAAGIREGFLQPAIGDGRSVAVLAEPVGEGRRVGWVFTHSYGVEQMNLDRFEVLVARALAAAGFPTLRFQCQGYGDSEHRGRPPTLADHLDGTLDAVALMAARDGVGSVGLFGTRFGAMVAGLVSQRTDVAFLGFCQPFVRGSEFLRDSFRLAFLRDFLDRGSEKQAGLEQELDRSGWADVDGFRLEASVYREVEGIDLLASLERFTGRALVLGIARGESLAPGPAALAAHLRRVGGTCDERVVPDRSAFVFGQKQYHRIPGNLAEVDTQFDLSRSLATAVVGWALERCVEGSGER